MRAKVVQIITYSVNTVFFYPHDGGINISGGSGEKEHGRRKRRRDGSGERGPEEGR